MNAKACIYSWDCNTSPQNTVTGVNELLDLNDFVLFLASMGTRSEDQSSRLMSGMRIILGPRRRPRKLTKPGMDVA